MSFDGLRAVLRVFFWALVYLGTFCSAVLVFAPAGGLAFVGWLGVLYVIWHDAHHRFTTTPERIKP